MLKDHVFETASRAYLLRKRFPGLQVFGGVVLNGSVGGLNPQAVQWMWRTQGQYGKVGLVPHHDIQDGWAYGAGRSIDRSPSISGHR